MKRPLAVLAALLIAAPAFATTHTWYVSPSGSLSNGGTNGTTDAYTVAGFNANAVAGDTCLIMPGTYATKIEPRHTGSPAKYIVYIGNVSDPYAAVFPAINVDSTLGATRCISIKGVGVSGDVSFKTDSSYTAGYDTLSYSIVRGALAINGRDNVNINHCTIGTGDATDKLSVVNNMPTGIARWDSLNPLVAQRNYNRYRSTFVDSLCIADNTFNLATTGNGSVAAQWRGVQKSQILRNRFTLSAISTTDTHLNTWYDCSYNTVNDNWFSGNVVSSTMPATYLLNMRDNDIRNSWARDTLVQASASTKPLKVGFNTAGTNRDYGELADSVRTFDFGDSNNTFTSLFVRVGDVIECQSKADNNVYQFNTLVTGSGLWLSNYVASSAPDSNASDSVVFRHNTVFSSDPIGRVILPDGSKLNHSIFTHNIIVAASPHSATSTRGHFGFNKGSSFTKCDSNLVWCQTGADSMWAVNLDFLSGNAACKVGANSTWGTSPYSYDRLSKWGDPQFLDSTYVAFDPTPNPAGIAYSSDWADGYVGARALPSDVTAPVVTITGPTGTRYWASGESMPLTWTASDAVGVVSFSVQWASGPSPIRWGNVTSGLAGTATGLDWTLPSFVRSYATVRVLAYDAAGNVGTASMTFRCDVNEGSDIEPELFPE